MDRQLKWYSFRWKTGVYLLVIFGLCWYFLIGRFLHPVGEGPAGPHVNPQVFAHIWSNDKYLLLGLGDSVTAGYGSSYGGYFDLMAKNDDAVYPEMRGAT